MVSILFIQDDDEIPARLCNYADVYNNEFITPALDFMQATASETEIAKFGVAVDDVIITKDSESWDDIGVPALVRETVGDLVCGYHLALLRPFRQKMDGGFLFRCLQAKPVRVQLELAASGVTRFGIPESEIGTMKLPVPPLVQQRAIADYLDRETMRLDALVEELESRHHAYAVFSPWCIAISPTTNRRVSGSSMEDLPLR